jgi:hypothetical protein
MNNILIGLPNKFKFLHRIPDSVLAGVEENRSKYFVPDSGESGRGVSSTWPQFWMPALFLTAAGGVGGTDQGGDGPEVKVEVIAVLKQVVDGIIFSHFSSRRRTVSPGICLMISAVPSSFPATPTESFQFI